MEFVVRHVAGSLTGRVDRFVLGDGDSLSLGRLPESDIAFDPHVDIAASGRHATVTRRGNRLLVEDLGSSNGTYVNGRLASNPIELQHGDSVELGGGGPRFVVELPGLPTPVVGPQASSGPVGDARPVGPRTVALMINQATQQTTRKFSLLIVALGVLLLASIGVIVFLAIRSEQKASRQDEALANTRAELDRATDELALTRSEIAQARAQLEGELQKERNRLSAHNLSARLKQKRAFQKELERARVEVTDEMRSEFETRQKELEESLSSVGTTLNQRYGEALFMLVFEPDEKTLRDRFDAEPQADRPGFDEGFCTAFAVTPDGWLATNAHCVDAIFQIRYDLGRRGVEARFVAKRNRDSATLYPLLLDETALHPRYTHAASPDVGLLKLDLAAAGKQRLDTVVTLASSSDALALAIGQPIYTLGFPGKVMDPYRVNADFRGGNVARLTDFRHEDAGAPLNQFVWHTALISKGTSGSPIFDRRGLVIAINNGTMSAENIVTSDGTTEEVKTIYSADGLNFGVRIDLLRELLEARGVALPTPAAVP